MFFYIGNNCSLLNQVSTNLFLDQGWTQQGAVWYKGYSTECNIGDRINDIIQGYKPKGIWAVIDNNTVYHSELRGFPLYQNGNELTNIPNLPNFQFVPSSITWSSDLTELPLTDVVDTVLAVFSENVNGFMTNNPTVNLNVIANGGLDSTLGWAAIHNKFNYNLIKTNSATKEYTSPLLQHMISSTPYQAYNLVDVKSNTNWSLTGFYAEVMTARAANMFQLICRALGTTVYDSITSTDYMYYFFQTPKVTTILNNITTVIPLPNLRRNLLDGINHVYYVWHIDNNFYFNPFYDKRIAEACVRLPYADLTENCKNGTVERLVIEKINPNFLSLISTYKNYGNVFENLDNNIANI